MKAVKNNVYSINSSSLLKRKSKEKYFWQMMIPVMLKYLSMLLFFLNEKLQQLEISASLSDLIFLDENKRNSTVYK